MIFPSTKSENSREEQVLQDGGPRGVGNCGSGEDDGGKGGGRERGGRMNMVQTMYTHVYKCKIDTC
jgi:hypothetical protein